MSSSKRMLTDFRSVARFSGMTIDYREDPKRGDMPETGIYVRAITRTDGWGHVDISRLDRPSLEAWLGSRPGLAIRVVLMLLGHVRTPS